MTRNGSRKSAVSHARSESLIRDAGCRILDSQSRVPSSMIPDWIRSRGGLASGVVDRLTRWWIACKVVGRAIEQRTRDKRGRTRGLDGATRRCSKNEKRPEKKKRGICGEGEDSRGRKRKYDRAFLVASIHVSSVTRVMSYVKEIRGFSSQAVLPFPLSLSLLPPFPSTWLVPRRYLLLSIGMYVRGKQSVCLRGRRQRA